MKFSKHMKLDQGLAQIDIAPLIDVIFILLAFFMLTSQFIEQPAVKIDLPESTKVEGTTIATMEIIIDEQGIIYYHNRPITTRDLFSEVEKQRDTIEIVYIQADKNAFYGRVMEVWDILKVNGINQISMGARRKSR